MVVRLAYGRVSNGAVLIQIGGKPASYLVACSLGEVCKTRAYLEDLATLSQRLLSEYCCNLGTSISVSQLGDKE